MPHTTILGMPQLNYNGLDEIWLLKTLGDIHWNKLGKVTDMFTAEDRYYASFFNVNIKFEQESYEEGNKFDIESKLEKWNKKIYRSTHKFGKGTATLDSIFVKKHKGGLAKHDSNSTNYCDTIKNININQHLFWKKYCKNYHKHDSHNIPHKMVLPFNPILMFNGVKILYFANYVFLAQMAEWESDNTIRTPIREIQADMFGNIDVNDKVYASTWVTDKANTTYLFRVKHPFPPGDKLGLSGLKRPGDEQCIARIKIQRC